MILYPTAGHDSHDWEIMSCLLVCPSGWLSKTISLRGHVPTSVFRNQTINEEDNSRNISVLVIYGLKTLVFGAWALGVFSFRLLSLTKGKTEKGKDNPAPTWIEITLALRSMFIRLQIKSTNRWPKEAICVWILICNLMPGPHRPGLGLYQR